MHATVKGFIPDQQSLIPALIFQLEVSYVAGAEIPLSLLGKCMTDDLKVISHLSEYHMNTDTTSFSLQEKAVTRFRAKRLSIWNFHLTAPISKAALVYIENRREKHPDKDVHLRFEFVAKFFSDSGDNTFQGTAKTTLMLKVEKVKADFIIPQIKWLKICSPYFEIGNFVLLEMRLHDSLQVDTFWEELYGRLFKNVQEMEKYIRQGEWGHVMTIARRYFENLKIADLKSSHKPFKEKFSQLLQKDGHAEKGINELYDGIWKLFEFTSKYVHEKDKNGDFNPILVTTKEDAYFAFSLSIGLLNLIGRKFQRPID